MRTEKDLHNYLRMRAKSLGVLFHKLGSKSIRGFPDVMLARDGQVVFVELKSPSGKGRLHPLQTRCHAEMRDKGLRVVVAASTDEVEMVLELYSS